MTSHRRSSIWAETYQSHLTGNVRGYQRKVGRSSRGEFAYFVRQDSLHETAWLSGSARQRPFESFGCRELNGSAAFVRIAPESHEAADSAGSPTKPFHMAADTVGARRNGSETFDLFDQPFDQQAGFRVAQTAGERFVAQDRT